jgi:DNA topoisomerase-1
MIPMKLVIVESPAKAKTIEKYLGKEYIVRSSVGHVRDLPKSNKDAIDIDAGFVPRYEISKGKHKVINELSLLAKKADEIILAPDPDREGEAIAWHLKDTLEGELKNKLPEVKRVTFNEITPDAITEAMQHPREIDMDLKQAQEARRVLDRLVGYDLSGLIWKKVRYGLSAGRVQSPALRILMEREREIRSFIPEPYWILEGDFKAKSGKFPLSCSEELKSKEEADRIVELAKTKSWSIIDIKETETSRKPKPPFRTSTLQQTASSRLGFSPSQTMRAAQKLYEAGHITYMRTDSFNLSKQALAQTASLVEKRYGKKYVNVTQYQTKSKNAQEAHEAIRPTNITLAEAGATEEQRRLYDLILRRTISSQMVPAILTRTKLSANIEGESIPSFVTTGVQLVFDGWLAADPYSRSEDVELPQVTQGEGIELVGIQSIEKHTTPPNRYSEAGLVKELEKRGIGRPSTYASIIKTIIDRGYVEKEGRTLIPTDTGDVVSSFLEEHFESYIGDDFTAEMETQLDDIAQGKRDYVATLKEFYTPFKKEVDSKEDIEKLTNLGPAPEQFTCPKCGSSMVYKLGRSGKFISCSNYPDCDGALTLEGKSLDDHKVLGVDPKTGKNIYVREGRFGPYVQLGETPVIPKKTTFPKGHKKTEEEKALVKKEKELIAQAKAQPKPKRASLPKNISPEDITLEQAIHLLILPRELGTHPDSGETVIANIGRFGPYVGHGKEFRSIKKTSGLDPYTISFDEAVALLNEPKALPKGVTLAKDLGKHPKTGKQLRVLQSRSGYFLQKGLKRIYLPDKVDIERFDIDEALKLLSK